MQIVLDIVLFLIYIFIFLLLCAYTWRFWMMYVNQKYMDSLKWVLLEIKLPRNIFKSPQATEMAAVAFLQTGGIGTWYDRNIKGNLPVFSSLEIASIEGDVRFFIRTQTKFKSLVSNNFYSQYPGIEITEADDYVTKVYYDHRADQEVAIWGTEYFLGRNFTLQEADDKVKPKKEKIEIKNDGLPIKTYVDFGLDKDPKEEFKHDPLTPVLEWLGSLGKGEHGWYQIMVQDEGPFDDKKFPATYVNGLDHKHLTFKDLVKLRIEQLRTKKVPGKFKKGDTIMDEYGNPKTRTIKGKEGEPDTVENLRYGKDDEDKVEPRKEMDLYEDEKNEVKAILNKRSKPVVRAAMRVLYLNTTKERNDKFLNNLNSVLNIAKHFSAPGYNALGISGSDPYSYGWEDTFKKRKPWRKEEFFEAYVEREGFYPHIETRNKKSEQKNFVDIDDWWDWAMFKKSLGFRKISRMIWEGIFYPFHHPHPDKVFVINLEELATLWHLPGEVATTPGLRRIDSIKSDAPTNLPI